MLWKLVVSAFILPSFLGLEIAAASSIKNNVQTLAESEIMQTRVRQDLENQENNTEKLQEVNNPYSISHHRRRRYRRNHYRRSNYRRRHHYRRSNSRRTYKNSNYWRNYYRGYYRTLYNRRYNQDCDDSHDNNYRYYRTRNRRYYDH